MAATMAPNFGLQPEDSMEISSEYGNMDADIDIDLDGQPDNMIQDDQQMLDDPKSDRADDVMLDDAPNTEDNDRVMQDDAPAPEQDEELLDFSDDDEDIQLDLQDEPQQELEPQIVAPPQPQASSAISTNPSPVVEEPVEQVQSEIATELLTKGVQPIDNTIEQQNTSETQSQPESKVDVPQQDASQPDNHKSESANTEAPIPTQQDEASQSGNVGATESVETALPTETPAQESVTETTEAAHDENSHPAHDDTDNQQNKQGNNEHPDVSVQQDSEQPSHPTLAHEETEASTHAEAEDVSRERSANSPTVTGLHQTIVEYEGNEVYLFPSRDPVVSEQYLLDNENLVTTSLGDLLQACRTALGDGVSEEEELVLGVEELDLFVSEDSTPAFSTSFSELLDVYLQLHKLDGNNNPLPFRVTLTTKTRFTNRLSSITQQISEGKGFSQLDFLQLYQYDEPTELPEDDFDDDFEEHSYPGQHNDEDKENTEESQTGVDDSNALQESTARGDEADQVEQGNTSITEGQEREYEGEAHGQDEESAETADQSELNQEETQYFDAQGDAPEAALESHEQDQIHEGEADNAHGEITAEDGEENFDEHNGEGHEDSARAEQNEQNTAAEEQYEQYDEEHQSHDADGDGEHQFGQGEFFDEENFDYQDEETAHEDEDEAHIVGEADEGQTHDQAAGPENSDEHNVDSGENVDVGVAVSLEESTDAPVAVSEDFHDQGSETRVEDNAADDSVQPEDDENFLEGVDGQEDTEPQPRKPAADDDDFDEINFDDEDDFDDQDSGVVPETMQAPSKTSPGGKRSFSELDENEDNEQDSKKARAS